MNFPYIKLHGFFLKRKNFKEYFYNGNAKTSFSFTSWTLL